MCKTDNIKLHKNSKQLNQPIFSPDKVATSCSVEAVSDDDFGDPNDFSGEGLREVEEIELRVRDAIITHRRFQRCQSTRQKFETKSCSLCLLMQFSINYIFN